VGEAGSSGWGRVCAWPPSPSPPCRAYEYRLVVGWEVGD
jgi:hypothetical protein